MATYDLTQSIPSSIATGDILNIPYSGAAITFNLPKGIFKLEVWGAQGGYRSNSTYGGKGGYASGTLTNTTARNIYIYSGGSGNTGGAAGGFNGGGRRSSYNGGGGASDIRLGTDSLYARVIVAGGGGSDGASSKTGMYGGGEIGGSSTESYGTGGYGGAQNGVSDTSWQTTSRPTGTSSQSDAYAGFGFGGNGISRSSGYGGAGGSGWYGGSGSYPDGSGDDDRGGGGGSGYVYTSSSATNYPTGCLLTSDDYLTNASLIAGNSTITDPDGSSVTGHSGNGYVRITVIKVSNLGKIKVNGVWKDISNGFVKINGSWKNIVARYPKINSVWKGVPEPPPPFTNPLNTDQLTLGQTGVYFTAYPDITWQVQHLDGNYVYLALYPMTETTTFGSSTTYSGSTIATKCTTYLNSTIPNVADYLESVTVNSVTAKVFIPSYDQLNSEWDWPKAGASNRICQLNGFNKAYWTSTAINSSYVWYVSDSGGLGSYTPSFTIGFRPAVKVQYKA